MAEERILDKIQKILNLANHPNTGAAEREAFLEKADKMMFEHAVEQAELDARKTPEERRKPVVVRVHLFDPYNWYKEHFRTILVEIARANRVRIALHGDATGDGTLVGFADDVAWAEMLWLHIFREFVAKLQPSWDRNQSRDYNVKVMKEAGFRWIDIWMEMYRHKGDEEMPCGAPPKDGGWLIRAYKRQCKIEGVEADLKTQKHEAYKWTFANAFANRICARLRELNLQHEESKALVVSMQDVTDAFYEAFPGLRPLTPEEQAEQMRRLKEQARREEEEEAERVAAMTPEQRQRYMAKKADEQRKEARRDEAYWRKQEKIRAQYYDSDGSRAGRRAADSVRLDRTTAMDDTRKGQIDG